MWLNFLGGANHEIGAPGVLVLFGALHFQVKISKCKSDRLKIRPGIFELRNGFYLYEDGGNGNLISVSLSFEKSNFFGRGGATMVCADEKFSIFTF